MAYSPNEPLFADRYRFEPIDSDWDRGRSGFTRLVSDLKNNERKGVIKRAEIASKHESGLLNETNALKTLRGRGVPEVYDHDQTNYESKNYVYLVIEYIDGARVEKELSILTNLERAEILAQFLGILTQAHSNGIVNGDVDLKHLFWRKEKPRLVVIDWGNSILNVDKSRKTEFAYDLARTAEIIYALVVGKTPPATGSIALPDDSKLVSGLAPLPGMFRELCQWAPRTPIAGAIAPCTASELFEVAVEWKDAIKRNKSYIPKRRLISNPLFWILLLIGFVGLVTATLFNIPNSILSTLTPTIFTVSPNLSPPKTVTLTSPTSLTSTETGTPTAEVSLTPTQNTVIGTGTIPPPKVYSSILAFNFQNPINPILDNCWNNTTSDPLGILQFEGFSHRNDGYWRFGVEKNREVGSRFETDFSHCPINGKINAISMNIFVPQIEEERELGFFLEDTNGKRREYTIWLKRVNQINQVDNMYLRVKDGSEITDYELLTTGNLKSISVFPRLYYQFSLLIFLEINNDGWDILYTKESPLEESVVDDIDLSQLIRADNVARPSLGAIQSFGLVGYGGEIQSVIWPLAFMESK